MASELYTIDTDLTNKQLILPRLPSVLQSALQIQSSATSIFAKPSCRQQSNQLYFTLIGYLIKIKFMQFPPTPQVIHSHFQIMRYLYMYIKKMDVYFQAHTPPPEPVKCRVPPAGTEHNQLAGTQLLAAQTLRHLPQVVARSR